MKKMARVLLCMLCACALVSYPVDQVHAGSKIQTWYLGEPDGYLDWGGSSSYISSIQSAVSIWNAYKPGVIRYTTSAGREATVSDFTENSSVAGRTWSIGAITFNTYNMNGYSSTQKLNVAIHEFGHALGLAHNESGDVMYEYVSNVTTLSANDKASYNVSYARWPYKYSAG